MSLKQMDAHSKMEKIPDGQPLTRMIVSEEGRMTSCRKRSMRSYRVYSTCRHKFCPPLLQRRQCGDKKWSIGHQD